MILVKGLWFKYPSSKSYALKGIDLEIREGEFVAIMGDNGAGKTTLIKHFNGLLKPSKGDVYIDGINTRNSSVAELSKKVAVMFQYPEKMFFCETVYKEVEFGLRNFGFSESKRTERINNLLRKLNLIELRDKSPFLLSGGEQRRLALSCILAWDPKYIVLDEPTAGQDRFNKNILINIIKTLLHEGKTIIIVTHDVEFVAELKPRVVLMNSGKIEADGSADDILTNLDILRKVGLTPPSIVKLTKNLKDHGYISELAVNIEDFLRIVHLR